MSAILVVDPNVLLAAAGPDQHRDSVWVLRAVHDRRYDFCVGMDPELQIYDEYMLHERLLTSVEVTNAFMKTFMDRRARGRVVTVKDAILTDEDRSFLASLNCTEPVEPELIAVGKAGPPDCIVLTLGEEHEQAGIRKRGTNSVEHVDELHKRYCSLQVWPVSGFDKKLSFIERSRYPGNEAHLRDFLRATEYEYMEWKQPGHEVNGVQEYSTRLTWSIIDKALQAVCAMLNSNGGVVLVGVTKDGEVMGIQPRMTSDGKPDDDLLLRRFTDRFCWFNPSPNRYVKPATIPLDNGRRVVALHVFGEATDKRYSFDDGVRVVEWERSGASNRDEGVLGKTQRPGFLRPPHRGRP